MRYLEFYSYIVFISVQAAVNTKAVGVSCFELVHIHLQDFFKVVANAVCPDCEIPSDVAEFLRNVVEIKVMSLNTELFDYVCDFSACVAQAECGVQQKVTFRKLVRLRCP